MTKIKKYYVGSHEVNILAWFKDAAVIERLDTLEPQSPRWEHLSDIVIKWI